MSVAVRRRVMSVAEQRCTVVAVQWCVADEWSVAVHGRMADQWGVAHDGRTVQRDGWSVVRRRVIGGQRRGQQRRVTVDGSMADNRRMTVNGCWCGDVGSVRDEWRRVSVAEQREATLGLGPSCWGLIGQGDHKQNGENYLRLKKTVL